MSDLATVRNDLETATAALESMHDALRGGGETDLDSFNLLVAETCKAAVQLPKGDAAQIRPQLEQLLSRLNDLRAEIESEQALVEARIAGLHGTASAPGALAPASGNDPQD